MMEALQSPMWTAGLVAEHALRWLRAQNEGHGFDDRKELVGQLLHEMLCDREYASKLCGMLDAWKAWADIGGMKRTDYEFIQADRSTFARATLLVALIVDVSTASETTLAVDLQQCLNLWKQVRLG
jgi:hypothetical protein